MIFVSRTSFIVLKCYILETTAFPAFRQGKHSISSRNLDDGDRLKGYDTWQEQRFSSLPLHLDWFWGPVLRVPWALP